MVCLRGGGLIIVLLLCVHSDVFVYIYHEHIYWICEKLAIYICVYIYISFLFAQSKK